MRVTRNYMSALMNANKNTSSRRRMSASSSKKSAGRYMANTTGVRKSDSTMSVYQNMKNNAGEVQSAASKLTNAGDNSIFAKAKESGDTSEITKQVKEFVSSYNSMVQNLKNGTSRVDTSYLNQLNSYASMHRNALQATGVTKRSDGTLTVDDKVLNNASLEQLEQTWGSGSGFTTKAGTTAAYIQSSAVSSMNSLVNNSYSSLLRNFGSSGSFFNFWS
ncbi:MAG: hypothetical protein NC313_15705 [Butyrivibrio sp.]|nr:hypothetical protein [Butyrivibrio sp.]